MREEAVFDFICELTMAMCNETMYIKHANGKYFSKFSNKELNNFGCVVDEILDIIRDEYE